MEGFGILELLKTLLEKPPQQSQNMEEPKQESAPAPAPPFNEESVAGNSFLAFAAAHDERARKTKKR